VRPEPNTAPDILKEIEDLRHARPGFGPVFRWWIDRRIVDLEAKLEKIKCQPPPA
jgi:hypothetical protein